MIRGPHETVATVLVDPAVLLGLELDLMARDLRVWPVRTAPICPDGPRREFQVRRSLLMRHRGAWDDAQDWTPVWVAFGPSWHHGPDPLPWTAHRALWDTLDAYGTSVRFHRRLGGVDPLPWPRDVAS